jgi:hypothetical protein
MEINIDTKENTRCYKLAGLANNLFVILPLVRLTFVIITKENIQMQKTIECEHFFCETITTNGKLVAHILLSLLYATILHL